MEYRRAKFRMTFYNNEKMFSFCYVISKRCGLYFAFFFLSPVASSIYRFERRREKHTNNISMRTKKNNRTRPNTENYGFDDDASVL